MIILKYAESQIDSSNDSTKNTVYELLVCVGENLSDGSKKTLKK